MQILFQTSEVDTTPSPIWLGDTSRTDTSDQFRVLLLEDNESNAFLIESYLDEMDLPPPDIVTTIADAYAYKAAILAEKYDLVICDLMLPDGQSFRFIADLLAAGFDRIAIYSARGRGAGASDLIDLDRLYNFAKPLEFRSFRDGVNKLVACR